jgi:hypothetical protein
MRKLKPILLAILLFLPTIAPVLAVNDPMGPDFFPEENAERAYLADQFKAPVSGMPKEWVSTSNFGEIIYERPPGTEGTIDRESVTLTGTLLTDDLPPYDKDYPSGFPWSKEEVQFEVTKFGEVPSTLIGTEHVKSQIPIQGEILEIWFIGSTLGHPTQEPNDEGLFDFVRYVWAMYSRPGDPASVARFQTALGGYNPFTGGLFDSCEEVYEAYGPDQDVGAYPGDFDPVDPMGEDLDGSWVGCIIPDNLKVMVNSTRVNIVKADMHLEFVAPDGTHITTTPGFFNFGINKTFVFYKDKKYIKELKNIKITIHKDVAERLKIQWMQVKEFDVDWGKTGQFAMDNAFIQNFIAWTQSSTNWNNLDDEFEPGMQKYPGDYSLAIVEPDEVTGDPEHTGYWAFYPVVSNYDVNFVSRARNPWPDTSRAWPGASNTARRGLRMNGRNLVMGAWNFTMLNGDHFHLATVEGAVEEKWTDSPDHPDWPDPTSPSDAQLESLYELVWALDEVFDPLFTLNKIGDEFGESILDGERDGIGYWWPFLGPGYSGDAPGHPDDETQTSPNKPYDDWPWWDAQRDSWGDPDCGLPCGSDPDFAMWYNLGIFVVGATPSENHWPAFNAQTADTTAAIDVAQVFDRYHKTTGTEPIGPDGQITVDGPYRSALDIESVDTPVAMPAGPISLHRWYYWYDGTYWHEKPVKISSIGPFVYPYQYYSPQALDSQGVDMDSFPPWSGGDGYTYPYFHQEMLEDKFNVWHTLTFGGPGVNLVTNYFNDFSSSLFLLSEDDMPEWPWTNPTWNKGKFVGDRADHQIISNSVIYSPASKRVYKDYKEADDTEHYFALVSVVMDHNITREYVQAGNQFKETFPWAGFIVAGLRAEGTRMAGSYVAHTFQSWFFLNTMNIGQGANPGGFLEEGTFPSDSHSYGWGGATFMILEFIDMEQDGHVDLVSVVEVGNDIVSDKTVVPCVWYIDWQGNEDEYETLEPLMTVEVDPGVEWHHYWGLLGPDQTPGTPDDVVLVKTSDDDSTAGDDAETIWWHLPGRDNASDGAVGPLERDGLYFSQKFYCLDHFDNAPTYGPYHSIP